MLAGLGLYGCCTAAAGLALAVGFGSGAGAAADSSAVGPGASAGRTLSAAPVLPAREGGVMSAAESASVPDAVPSAQVAGGSAAGAPFRPTELVLPSGTRAPVHSSGLHPDGALVVPEDPAVVGWWDGGALAGDAFGDVVVAGHVDSARFGLGVMAELRTLAAGDVVELQAPGRSLRYRITGNRSLPQADLVARTDVFQQDIAHRLVLITCGGRFDRARHRYQDNLVVYAEPVPDS